MTTPIPAAPRLLVLPPDLKKLLSLYIRGRLDPTRQMYLRARLHELAHQQTPCSEAPEDS